MYINSTFHAKWISVSTLLFTCFVHCEISVAILNLHPNINDKRIRISTVLFTCLACNGPKIVIQFHPCSLCNKRTRVIILLLIRFVHFKWNITIYSYHQTSYHSWMFFSRPAFISCSDYCNQTCPLRFIIKHQIKSGYSQPDNRGNSLLA